MKTFKRHMTSLSILSITFSIILLTLNEIDAFGLNQHKTDPVKSSFNTNDIDFELFFVGDLDVNTTKLSESPVYKLIISQLNPGNKNQAVVFLGNTIGKDGIPSDGSPLYKEFATDFRQSMDRLTENSHKVYLIPGNYEWFDGSSYTLNSLLSYGEFVNENASTNVHFTPGKGCGEPKPVELTDELVLVMIDSQWLLQGDDSDERKRSGCDVDNKIEFVSSLQEILADYKGKNVVIASHHPIYSNGKTGGNFSTSNHFFPLPILGSVIVGIKKLFSSDQQFGHPLYEEYRSAMQTAMLNNEGITMISAHDHNMQYLEREGNHYIVAGSGNNTDFVRNGGDAIFTKSDLGFAKITFTKCKELWLEFYIPDPDHSNDAVCIFRKLLQKQQILDNSILSSSEILKDYPKTIKVKASDFYSNRRLGMGGMYRKEWGAEIEVPVLLLDDVYGGLKPVKQGGGFQTKTLRLENQNGTQFVLRSVNKDATKSIPVPLRNTFAQTIIQDGMAAKHPYGAAVIPEMAEAAGIYHTNPKFVWLPKQLTLGRYNIDFADKLYLFEERPGGNTIGHPDFGGTQKTLNTFEVYEQLSKNHKHKVDQHQVLRARLFDILIGDWDRHEDQWRWGIYSDHDQPGVNIYRAIPRDRDQVFFKNDGFFNYLIRQSWFDSRLQKFDAEIKNLKGLLYSARHFDRKFLSQLTSKDFVKTAEEIQKSLTDEVIEKAFKTWPEEIYNISADEIIRILKARRDKLVKYAIEFYNHISKEVTVSATNGNDVFEINTLPGDRLEVKTYFRSDDLSKNLIYHRTLNGKETNELRLFGLKSGDKFYFSGDGNSSIKVRLIGGGGNDSIINNSSNLKIFVYDKPDGMELKGNKVESRIADKRGINKYDPKDWDLNRTFQFPMISFYTDEGIGLKYNIWWKKFGFRTRPYKSLHSLSLAYFWTNTAFVGKYSGHWPNAIADGWDAELNVIGRGPAFTQYYYGLGNEYLNYEKIFSDIEIAGNTKFHIVKGTTFKIQPSFNKNFQYGNSIGISPSFELINLINDIGEADRFIRYDEANLKESDFETKIYAGFGVWFKSKRLDSSVIPTRGFDFTIDADYKISLLDSEYTSLSLRTNFSSYIPFGVSHSVILAMNMGGAYTFGDYEFFHANYLSNASRLRGYKTNRFGGDGIIYHATDLRIKLSEGNDAFRSSFGIFGSFDYGRAFLSGEGVSDWHVSYGGGFFFTPLEIAGFKIGYYTGQEDSQLSIGGSMVF